MASFILEATPRLLPRSLTCCVPSPTAHMLHVRLLREEGFCGAAGLQDRETFELYARQALSWKRHLSAVASKLDLLRTLLHNPVSSLLVRTKSHGPLNSFTLRTSLSCYSGNPQTLQSLISSHAFGTCAATKIIS